ncbi:MAG: hypothetical protein D3912_12095 [Candidatus Electrothrix sp. AX1]|nr:hypothetical protein [Candidatus Electrothrix sp. AX1]
MLTTLKEERMTNKVLAGPILRRTTKNRVCVWLATSEPMQLQLTITDCTENILGTGAMDTRYPQGIQLGKHLFVHLLQARPKGTSGYPFDTLMYYSIDQVSNGNKETVPLFSAEELQKITYGPHTCPSFFIPSALKNLLHGSCRKPHGMSSSADALILGHARMQATCDDLDRRPALLFLAGDQIYADDVALSLHARLKEVATQLTGQDENMPQIGSPRNILLHGRKQVLRSRKSGFSSGKSENHLFSFGEYAAMYLYAFGNLSAWEPVWDWSDLKKIGFAPGEEEHAQEAYTQQHDHLYAFHNTLADIRRLLANIPTYMLFDDHDVTDDWNITHSWYDTVRQSALGRRIVSNALAACWAFQSWGNDPDNFHKDMIWSIQQRLTDTENDPAVAERYDLYTWKHRGWGFSVPTFPPVIAVDSRTQRQYDDYNLPARLMDRYALDWLRVEWAKLLTDNDIPADTWPILITATPVLGFKPIEAVQNWTLRITKKLLLFFIKKYFFFLPWSQGTIDRSLVNIMDIESWTANKRGYKAFFDTLQTRMKLPGCVFISGDVHYTFSAQGEFFCNGNNFTCLQLTSSALKNMPSEYNQKLLEKIGNTVCKGKCGVRFALNKQKRWTMSSILTNPQKERSPIRTDCNVGLVQFVDGRPITYTLLKQGNQPAYKFKDCSEDDDPTE